MVEFLRDHPTFCVIAVLTHINTYTECGMGSEKIVLCWGNGGLHQGRSKQVLELLQNDLYCIVTNKSGEPKHPLYIKGNAELTIYKKFKD